MVESMYFNKGEMMHLETTGPLQTFHFIDP